jgi:hypothetical protein
MSASEKEFRGPGQIDGRSGMTKRRWVPAAGAVLGVLLALLAPSAADAGEIEGVTVAEEVTLGDPGERLVLRGAGVRKKLFVKVYVAALYLPAEEREGESFLDSGGPKRVSMHFLYKEVGREKLVEAWREGFSANLNTVEFGALEERLGEFCGYFETARRGDEYQLDFLPRGGTTVRFNGREVGTVTGEDFYRALLKVWLGPRPADKKLKKALLGP